ncbi:uncharacterized protein LOC143902394 [Temnothorax americanus]|uniref:uncharacterized protein LOC143902394 n=1 Tax=Temnothorax americanus TaxID=1964332 RepID=UPI004067C768
MTRCMMKDITGSASMGLWRRALTTRRTCTTSGNLSRNRHGRMAGNNLYRRCGRSCGSQKCDRCDEVRLRRIQARVLARARERAERRHHTRKPTKRRKRETAAALDTKRRKQGQKGRETDEDSTKEDNARATSPTRRKKMQTFACTLHIPLAYQDHREEPGSRGSCAASLFISAFPRHLLGAGEIMRCIEQAGCARRDARISANSRQRGTAVRTIKKKSTQDRARGSEVESVGAKEHSGERDRRRGFLILLDAEETDSINSRARERNNVVLGCSSR